MEWKQRMRDVLTAAGREPDEEIVEELAEHLRSIHESALAAGFSAAEARERVEHQLCLWAQDADGLKRRFPRNRAVTPPPAASASWFNGIAHDVRYAARLCVRQPAFTLLVVLTMALGIGAVTTLFSVTYTVLLRSLPWPQPDELVVVKETRGGQPPRFNSFTNAAYLAWREQPGTIEDLAAWGRHTVTLSDAGDAERIRVVDASLTFFPVLRAHPLIGSLFDERNNSQDLSIVVLSEGLWRERFGADPRVVGRVVRLDGTPYTVIGVLPHSLSFPDRRVRAWIPFRVPPTTGNLLSVFDCIARLRPGATPAQAAAEGTARGRFAADTGLTTKAIFGTTGPIGISARPLAEDMTAEVRQPLVVLLGAVLLLLLTMTANVASLQLVRATTRNREIAIRAALGAGTARVTRQLLVESLLLGAFGGAAGLFVAKALHSVLPSVLPADFPRVEHIRLDSDIVLFALVASVVTSIVFGLVPALRLRRLNLVSSLAENGASSVGIASHSGTGRARTLIIAGQIAIAFVLLVGASLLGRSFVALLTADRGYDPTSVITARLSLPASMYTPERRYAIVDQILTRLAAVPSVADASFTSEMPLTQGGSSSAFRMRAPHADGGYVMVQASPRIVSPRYFTALRFRVVEGRGLGDIDTETSPPVVVVNRAFARRYLGDSPLGAKLPMASAYQDTNEEATVVGVIDDVRYLNAANRSLPEMYFCYRQLKHRLAIPVATLVVRTAGDPNALAETIRTTVREADGRVVPEALLTMEDIVWTSLARPRLYAVLLGGFAGFALLIAAVGLFGVLSYGVAQRSREFALRAVLGASRADIIGLVTRQGLKVTVGGLVAGLFASVALTRAISALLYGVTRHDLLTFAVVPLIVFTVAAAACIVPAWRASRLDPQRVLREG